MVQPLNPQHLDPADLHYSHNSDEPVLERIAIATEGEDCDACVRKLREPLMRIPGVCDVRVNTKRERVIITFDARKTHPPDLHDAILASVGRFLLYHGRLLLGQAMKSAQAPD